MALTDIAIRNAKTNDKPKKLGDSGGLHLLVTPSGGKLWRIWTVSAVPEPAIWLMMLLGFGSVGYMLRTARRQENVTAVG